MMRVPFQPGPAGAFNVGLTSARMALPRPGGTVRLVNDSASRIYVAFGDSSVTATTSSMLMPSEAVSTMRAPANATHVAAITDSIVGLLGCRLNVCCGEGG